MYDGVKAMMDAELALAKKAGPAAAAKPAAEA